MIRLGGVFFAVCFVLSLSFGIAVAGKQYQEVRVILGPGQSEPDLFRIDPELELMGLGDGDVLVLSQPHLTEKIVSSGYDVEIIHEDLESYYAALQGPLTDYGVWHTYDEMVAEMNAIHADYPNLTTAPFSIGQTSEGREIWTIKVSDNPDVDEEEPEVLFDGVHHAREIITVEMNLFLPRYLCENYGTDPFITFLVDNREIWFVPIVNPDGFVYNELTNPNGGGMWRKNRRDNQGSGCYGVDINRNYPHDWGDNNGSSGDPCSDTYRGPSAGSEPESQAMMNFIASRNFITHDSIHSVVGVILYPWGNNNDPNPDIDTYRAICEERTSVNGYPYGTCWEMINYFVSGGMFDWVYGDAGVLSFTTEIGGSGFWPAQSEREGLIQENLYSCLYLMQVAGPSIAVGGLAVSGGNGDERIDPGETVDLVTTVENTGLFGDLENVTVQLRCDDPYVVLHSASNVAGTLGAGESYSNALNPFVVEAEAGCPAGRLATFRVYAEADGGISIEVPFVFQIGLLPEIAANDFEDAGEEWIQDETHTASTGAFVRVDPVATGYQPGNDTTPPPGVNAWITAQNPGGADGTDDVDEGISATRSPDFDLSTYESVRLSMEYFHGQRDTGDDANDFFSIDVSPDAGGSWVNLVFHGDAASQAVWHNLTLDLEQYVDLTGQVRFRVQAADGAGGTGYGDIVEAGIDDFTFFDGGSANQPPSAPALVAPPDGSPDEAAPVTLIVANAIDPEGNPLTYGFRVWADADLTDLVASADGVAEGAGETSWTIDAPLDLATYYWSAFAEDAEERSPYMEPGTFTITTVNAAGDIADGVRDTLTDWAYSAAPGGRGGVPWDYPVFEF